MLITAALSDKGKVRRINQDTIFSSAERIGELPDLFLVADGMGGHRAGDYCSRMLVERILSDVRNTKKGEPVSIVRSAIEDANTRLFKESISDPGLAGMGSTLVAAMIVKSKLYAFNVGDSRLYVIGSQVRQITRDHSFVEEMVDAGRMKRESSDYKNNKNIITRAIGIGMRVDVDVFELNLKKEDIILLCSDGLTNMMSDEEIGETIKKSDSLDHAAKELVRISNERGGIDNISTILIASPGREENP